MLLDGETFVFYSGFVEMGFVPDLLEAVLVTFSTQISRRLGRLSDIQKHRLFPRRDH